MEEIEKWLPRLHGLVVGPGLGREDLLLKTAKACGVYSLSLALKSLSATFFFFYYHYSFSNY